jgi:hypothetical protein
MRTPRPYLAELARFEWMISETFHSFDEAPFDRAQLAKIPLESWENLRIIFQPSVQLFQSEWPILALWEKRRAGKIEELTAPLNQKILIGRRGTEIRCEILADSQYQLIEGLISGQTLGSICESLAEKTGEEVLPIAEWFAHWVQDGLIARCEIAEEDSNVRASKEV